MEESRSFFKAKPLHLQSGESMVCQSLDAAVVSGCHEELRDGKNAILLPENENIGIIGR